MICTNCGHNNNDDAQFCVACGTALQAPTQAPTPYTQQPNGYNPYAPSAQSQPGKGLAITSLVLGIIAFICAPIITGILGIVFGGVAKSKGYRGGMATAGIVCGIIALVLWVASIVFIGDIYTDLINEFMYF